MRGSSDAPGKTAPDGYLQVNLRSDYQHVGRWPVRNATADLSAQAASGRGFDFLIDPGFRHAGQFTSLGCHTVG